ncbi:MAG: aminotransferase class III-fold pyridoxal phosphate-dependent enzyme [Planctomycetota bacterium]
MPNQAPLAAERLRSDPRLAEAKQLILDALAEHQKEITEVRGPVEDLVQGYQALLDQFGGYRGANVYFPYLGSGIGNGPFVELADGSVKLDLITGIGVHGYGHSHPMLVETGIDAAISDTVMQGNLQQNTSSCDIVKLLVDTACESGANLKHCFLSTSGAMANENSLKMAFQKHHPANRVIAFSQCFAGRTLGLAQITDKAKYRVGLPDTIAVDYIPFFKADDPQKSTEVAVNHLKYHLNRNPGKHAVLWMELVQGEGGYYPGDANFFRALCTTARENDVAVIADEVQTFCRTTRPFAFQHFGLDQHVDLVTIGKISQVCATLFTDDYAPKPGLISQTFTGSTWAIYAAHAIVKGLIDNGNFGESGRNVKLHRYFVEGMQRVAKKFPGTISGPHGIGGMVAFTPFDGSAEIAVKVVKRLYTNGLMSFMAGGSPSRVRFLMPLGCIEESHIDAACEILEKTIHEIQQER